MCWMLGWMCSKLRINTLNLSYDTLRKSAGPSPDVAFSTTLHQCGQLN